jgi:TonB family protein
MAIGAISHPTTFEGISKQFQEILRARQQGNSERLDELRGNLVLPEAQAWIAQNFADDKTEVLAEEYAKELAQFQSTLTRSLDLRSNSETLEIRLQRWERPAQQSSELTANEPKPAANVPVETYQITVAAEGHGSVAWLGTFAYLRGAYRFIGSGAYPFWSLNCFTVPSANFQMAQVVHREAPMFPANALQQRVQGTVRLHATIAKDGTVHELQVVDGHPALAGAALEAVRKWRYSPALLEGQAVEVPATMEVDFLLPR